MHASIALCIMMVGGPVFPDPEVTTVPLKDDSSSAISIQDQEWRERVKSKPLPRVPTVDDRQSGDDGRPRFPYSPTDPRAAHPNQGMMPVAPTSADNQHPMGNMPYQPGGGNPLSPQSGGSYPLGNGSALGHNAVSGYTGLGYPATPVTPTAGNYGSNVPTSVSQLSARYGLSNSQNTTLDPMGGGKPFSGYTPQNGFTPWQYLNQPTQGGTINPYTTYVQPALNQQNFNSHLSEQINGVQMQQRLEGIGTPGMETNFGGNGLVNPQIFQNYRNY
ncbi:MAG: hypothetical protein ACLP9L_12050 [Thermoguttaceae bacterium]